MTRESGEAVQTQKPMKLSISGFPGNLVLALTHQGRNLDRQCFEVYRIG